MNKMINKIYDHSQKNSLTANLRRKRMLLFNSLLNSLISSIETPIKILDVGGRPMFWKEIDFFYDKAGKVEITALNFDPTQLEENNCNVKIIVGDARNMKEFEENEFDVVFSNSVIEHVGNYEDQCQMAKEVMRVGKRYFVQTPNYYFPIEPHFVLPLFQFFPLDFRAWLLMNVGSVRSGMSKYKTKEGAIKRASSIKLLTKKELISLFPDAKIWEERFLGLTKSFIAYGGW